MGYCNWNQEPYKNMKLLYISLATQKTNYKIRVFVEKNEKLPVQGRVVDHERQIERDLWKLKRGETKGEETVRIWEERKSKEKGENWELTVRLWDRVGAKISCFP